MTTIQEKLMGLIQEIDAICRKHDIPYYLSGGSVIGAIRHKGFVPWDDDIDILLDSKYWDKFYRVFQEEMPENRTLGCIENNIEFPNMIYRYCDTSTTEIHKNELFGDSTAGTVIDVILLDSFPGGEELWNDHMKNLLLFCDLVNIYYSYSIRFQMDIPYKRYMLLSKLLGKKRVLKNLEKKLKQYENDNCDYYIVRWAGGPNVFPKDMFGTPKYVEFEGVSLPIPAKAGDFLRDLYGDEWVEVPEPDEQNPHNTITDFDRGYEEYFKEYVPRIGYKKAVKNYIKLKKEFIRTKKIQSENNKRLWLLEGLKEKYFISEIIRNKNLDPITMLENGDMEMLLSIFSEFMKRQGSSDYIGNEFWVGLTRRYDPVYVDLGDDYLSVLLWLWLYQGRLSKAYKVLRAREMVNKSELSPRVKEVKSFIDDMQKSISLYEQEKFDESLVIVEDLISRAICPVNNLWKLRIRLTRILGLNDCEKEIEWINNCLKHAPEDGELIKYKTDIDYKNYGIEKTYKDYLDAYSKTRNGIIWMELSNIFKKELPWALEQMEKYLEEEEYESAFELAKGWHTFSEENVDLQYVYCLCLTKQEENELWMEEKVFKYIDKYPDDIRFKNVLKMMREKMGGNTDYIDYEIRMKQTVDWEGFYSIKNELMKESSGDNDYKQILLAVLNNKLGEKKEEFEIYRKLLANGVESHLVDMSVSKDMRSMIKMLHKFRKNDFRKQLLQEWKMKYPNVDECVGYLHKCDMLSQDVLADAKIWIEVMLKDDENYVGTIEKLYGEVTSRVLSNNN